MLDGSLLGSDNRQGSSHLPRKGATPRHHAIRLALTGPARWFDGRQPLVSV